MTVRLITEGIWTTLEAAAKRSQRPAYVAVAYFGKGASGMLPLPSGSRIVANLSEGSVKSGQTCPKELKALYAKGVRVYSAENLHAKVFVLGSTAFVGSANASHRSSDMLQEAVFATTEALAVKAAREFVKAQCLHELGPKELDRLQEMYRPPRVAGGKRSGQPRKRHPASPFLRNLYLAQLRLAEAPEGSEFAQESGEKTAKKKMAKPRGHELQYFWWRGRRCRYKPGDVVVQVLKEDENRKMVSAPGTVIHTEAWRREGTKYTFVYLELRRHPRVPVERLAKRMGPGSKKRLSRGGRVGREFAGKLMSAWSD